MVKSPPKEVQNYRRRLLASDENELTRAQKDALIVLHEITFRDRQWFGAHYLKDVHGIQSNTLDSLASKRLIRWSTQSNGSRSKGEGTLDFSAWISRRAQITKFGRSVAKLARIQKAVAEAMEDAKL
jgi:hypothetical protein